MPSPLRVAPHVQLALERRDPLVGLESSVFAQGLPAPENRAALDGMLRAVTARSAIPAIAAVVRGVPTVGVESTDLERFLLRENICKVSARDLAAAVVSGADGATTVAAALALSRLAGIEVFATGGIGGVHRRLPGSESGYVDESADLHELAVTPMIVVCSGAKSILDVPATWERLETLGIPVIGHRTTRLPAFYTADSGIRLRSSVDSAGEIVALYRAHRALGRTQALVVVQEPPPELAIGRDETETAIAAALKAAVAERVSGAAVTPFLLNAVTRFTNGRSLEVNVALLERNAALATDIAVVISESAADSSS